MIRYYARTTRGIEWVAAAEITGFLGARVEHLGHRELLFTAPGPPNATLALRTVDDVFIHIATLNGIERSRASLAGLAGFRSRPVLAALDAVAELRPIDREAGFTVTASALGKRNYNRFEVEEVVGRRLNALTTVPFHARSADKAPPETDLLWRVHVRDSTAILGLRVGPTALHRRSYRKSTTTGSLHPPVAAALALVGGSGPRTVLVDPFCGAGTIVFEYVALGRSGIAVGADIDPVAIEAATRNAARVTHRPSGFLRADASHLPLASDTADLIVTNPPWDRRVALSGLGGDGEVWSEVIRVLRASGRLVVLSERPPDLPAPWVAADLGWVAVAGSKPRLVIYTSSGQVAEPAADAYLADDLRRWWPRGTTAT